MKNMIFCWMAFLGLSSQAALVTLDLTGHWEAVGGRYNDSLWSEKKSYSSLKWTPAPVPGSWHDIEGLKEAGDTTGDRIDNLSGVWYRTRFSVPGNCRGMQAVLRLLGARWEVAAWLNGEKIGQDLSGYGALEFNLSRALKEDGENVLLVRTGGWNSMPRSAAQNLPLFPTSSGPHWGPRGGAIQRGAEIAFFQDGRINKLKMDPKLAVSSVVVQAEIENVTKFHGRQRLDWTLTEKKSGKQVAWGEMNIPYHHSLKLKGNPTFYMMTLKLPAYQKWSLEKPFLYTARACLFLEGRIADSVQADFGMREFRVKDGQFELNRQPVFLRGGNLFGQDLWKGTPESRQNPEKIKAFLIDGARTFNFNCIRTHTRPMTETWNRSADENGLLVVSEMTLIVNGSGWVLTPEERKVFRENILKEYGRILPEVWNHPSTVMWSVSNESFWPDSGDWDAWETGTLTDWFTAQDSTRPILRAANPSRDVLDNHVFDGWWNGVEGDFLDYVHDISETSPQEKRPVTISEFIQFSPYTAAKWLGPAIIPDPDGNSSDWSGMPTAMNFHAQVAMEFTECMRLNGIKMILPYLFPDNGTMNPERINLPPVFYALKNAYSPQVPVLDLFNRHFLVKSGIKVPVSFVSDEACDKPVKAALSISADNPGFIPERLNTAGMKTLASATFKISKAGVQRQVLYATLPEKEGKYWLVLSAVPVKSEPVMSRREILVYAKPENPSVNAGYLGFPDPFQALMRKAGFRVLQGKGIRTGEIPPVLIVGPEFLSKEVLEPEIVKSLTAYLENGGRLLVMEQTRWLYPGWINLRIERMAKNGSGAAFFTGREIAGNILKGLSETDFYRFNGHPGDVVSYRITDIRDDRLVSWMKAQDGWKSLWEATCLAGADIGKGKIIFCQLNLSKRLNPEDQECYDPVCEKIFNSMLSYLAR